MSLRDGKVEYHYFEPLGMDLSQSPLLLADGAVEEAWNCDIDNGTYRKRNGISTVIASGELIANTSILAGIEYLPPTGPLKEIVFGTDGTGGGGTIYEIASGSFTARETGLDATARPFFIQIGSQLLFVNGVDSPVVLNNTTTKQYGITAPSALTATSSATSGSKLAGERYLIAITYYNSATGAESSPFIATPVVISGGHSSIALSFSAANSATADSIRVYCSYASSNILLLEDEISGVSTSYSATASDQELVQPQLELDNTRIDLLSSEVNFPALVDNRVFLKTAKNEIRHSKIGQSGPMFESFEASAVANTASKYGSYDDIVAIGSAGNVPIVVKERSVGRLDALGIPDTLSSVDNVRYVYTEISDNIGGIHHSAGTQVYGEYVFLSRNNIYATDGKDVRPICDQLSPLLRAAGFTSAQKPRVSAINDETNQRVLISFFESATATYPDYIAVGDYEKYPEFRWTLYRPGISRTTHPGMRVGCFYSKKTNLGAYDYFVGNTAGNGQIYQLDSGTNDADSAIYFKLKTKAYTFGDPAAEKLVKTCTFQAEGSGSQYDMQISSLLNLSKVETGSANISLDDSGITWDNFTWDQGLWAGGQQLGVNYEPHSKCRFFQLVIRQTSADAPLKLYSWDLRASVFRVA